jgi:hypothetical protein
MVLIKIISDFIENIKVEYNTNTRFDYIKEDILSNIEIYDYNQKLIDNNNINTIKEVYEQYLEKR